MNTHYFKRYLNQSETLPKSLREKIESSGEQIIFFALSDLSDKLELLETWTVLTPSKVFIAKKDTFTCLDRSSLKIRESFGKVANNLTLLDGDEIKETLWYGQRQKILFAQFKYLIEEGITELKSTANELYSEGVLNTLLKHQASTSVEKNEVVWRLLGYLKPYRKEISIGAIGAVGATLASLVPAYLSGQIIDDIVRPFQEGSLDYSSAFDLGVKFVLLLAFVYIIREFFIWLRLKKMSIMGEKVARDLRNDIFSHIQKLDMDFYSSKSTGTIIARVTSDTDRIWDFVAFGIVEVSIALFSLTGLSIMLISLDLKLGLIMTLPIPIIIYAIYQHGEKMRKLFLRCWRKWSEMTAIVSDTVPGVQVVKSFNQESREVKRFAETNQSAIDEFNKVHESWTKFWPLLFLGVQLLMIAVWAFALPRLIEAPGDVNYISAGTFVSFLLYMTMFTQPIEVIGQMARMLNRATSSAYRVFEILDTKPTLVQQADGKIPKLKGQIDFEDVLFSYDGVRSVLKGVTFTIKEGEMIGLVGPSGSGKSTITKLINRFYDPVGGRILIDGEDIKNLEIGAMRKQIAVVHQDPFLFHGSILKNITYGNEGASLSEVIEACKVANAHDFILKLKDRYDTVVGERGHTLSGGERQRISIARAILNDPRVLILDEATSAVDTETERKIQDALDKIAQGRTVIAIAHRLSTLRKADRIFVVKEGELAEVGTHQELMKIGGEYKKLQQMQVEMFNLMHGKGESDEKIQD